MNCEEVRISAMAIADGEPAPLRGEIIQEHVASCESCARAVAAMTLVNRALEQVGRRRSVTDLWHKIETRLENRTERRVLTFMALLLALYKVVEFVPSRDFGTWMQLAPLAIAAVVFAFLRQNPFQINTGLRQRGEEI